MIERVRPTPVGDELADLYRQHNNADRWHEHRLRVDVTIATACARFPTRNVVVDPAAGNGRAAHAISTREAVTGDLAPDAPVDYPGTPAEHLLADLAGRFGRYADVIVLGEILEHVDNPLGLLELAHQLARPWCGLILSTPLDEPAGVNPEHVWRWDKAGVLELLAGAGWRPTTYVELDLELPHWSHRYRCQIHAAEVAR